MIWKMIFESKEYLIRRKDVWWGDGSGNGDGDGQNSIYGYNQFHEIYFDLGEGFGEGFGYYGNGDSPTT